MENITTITINAMFYVFFVAMAGGMGIVAAALIGFKLYKRMNTPKQAKTTKNARREAMR